MAGKKPAPVKQQNNEMLKTKFSVKFYYQDESLNEGRPFMVAPFASVFSTGVSLEDGRQMSEYPIGAMFGALKKISDNKYLTDSINISKDKKHIAFTETGYDSTETTKIFMKTQEDRIRTNELKNREVTDDRVHDDLVLIIPCDMYLSGKFYAPFAGTEFDNRSLDLRDELSQEGLSDEEIQLRLQELEYPTEGTVPVVISIVQEMGYRGNNPRKPYVKPESKVERLVA